MDLCSFSKNRPAEKMSSSYNTIALSSTPTFLLSSAAAGPGPNNFNRQEAAMTMVQQQPTSSVAPPPKKRRNQPGNPSKYLLLNFFMNNKWRIFHFSRK